MDDILDGSGWMKHCYCFALYCGGVTRVGPETTWKMPRAAGQWFPTGIYCIFTNDLLGRYPHHLDWIRSLGINLQHLAIRSLVFYHFEDTEQNMIDCNLWKSFIYYIILLTVPGTPSKVYLLLFYMFSLRRSCTPTAHHLILPQYTLELLP